MEPPLTWLRAVAERTRLRLLAVCAKGELTVSDLAEILGQSQPRVSRHLKVLVDAGLLERCREGQWAFYRMVEHGEAGRLATTLVDLVPGDDPEHASDRQRLHKVKRKRAAEAEAYFRRNAAQWDDIRKLYVDDGEVEAALRRLVPADAVGELLDIGTGTGRTIEVFADRYIRALGIDRSREMLAVARGRLESKGLNTWRVRQGDMHALPLAEQSFDVATIHMALHHAEQPRDVIAEAARVIRPGGRLVVVDFAPHQLDVFRAEHAHQRLGFADEELQTWFVNAGLSPADVVHIPGRSLTVCLWCARKAANDPVVQPTLLERSAV